MKDQPSALALGSDMKNLGNKIISYANNINVISDSKLQEVKYGKSKN